MKFGFAAAQMATIVAAASLASSRNGGGVMGFAFAPAAPTAWMPRTAFTTTTTASSSTTASSPSALAMSATGIWDEWSDEFDQKNLLKDNEKYLSDVLQKRVEAMNEWETEIEELNDDELSAKTAEFRQRLKTSKDCTLDSLLEEAFAVVREASWRVLEQRHYDVQLMGGIILHKGRLAEMATGEGKTLVSTLPVYLNALQENSTSFVVTVNDYLARRDMEQMGQVHRYLGLTVGLIQSGMSDLERQTAYQCDVVYVTNSELGFDYLRDHLAMTPANTVLPQQIGNNGEFDAFCVVDEADSVLIDEARTPLIISQQVPAPANKYATAKTIADALTADVHYTVDLKNKNIILNQKGYRDTEAALGIESLFEIQPDNTAWAPFVANAVKAKELFNRDVEYSILMDNEDNKIGVGIIDSFTGRVLDGRRWSDGLHQSIEALEGIDVSQQSQVIAKVTYQSLFRQFSRLSGMTGTALADAAEFQAVYNLKVTPVPTALPVARRDYPDVAFKTRMAANNALIKECKNVGGGQLGVGRPCLIGTTSVQQSEALVAQLEEAGIPANLLNASPKNAPRESEIVAQAGRAGVVTVATNMAGRGTDILLGGCYKTMARIYVRSQLVQAGLLDPKEMELCPPSPDADYYPCEVSDEATLQLKEAVAAIRKFAGPELLGFIPMDELLTVATDATESDDDPPHVVTLRAVMDSVKELFREVTDGEKEIVQSLGGLYVMGTNRHESSRIDLQLRGRAGRQGDPGTSRFFLSFQDDMFVVFGGDNLKKILETFRVSDDMPVEAPQITKALDQVQSQVEEKYREIRTEILKFDDILNSQRRVIYRKRQTLLFASNADILKKLSEYNHDMVAELVAAQTEGGKGMSDADKNDALKKKKEKSNSGGTVNTQKVVEKVAQFFPDAAPSVTQGDLEGLLKGSNAADDIIKFCNAAIDKVIATKLAQVGDEKLAKTAHYIMLLTADNAWTDHLQNMESIKEGVILRKYQGLDPIAEYQNDALVMFEGLQDTMRRNAVFSVWQNLAAAAKQPVTA
jgi:preprotein translocase subunit SecA